MFEMYTNIVTNQTIFNFYFHSPLKYLLKTIQGTVGPQSIGKTQTSSHFQIDELFVM